jgi:hypothetical protein
MPPNQRITTMPLKRELFRNLLAANYGERRSRYPQLACDLSCVFQELCKIERLQILRDHHCRTRRQQESVVERKPALNDWPRSSVREHDEDAAFIGALRQPSSYRYVIIDVYTRPILERAGIENFARHRNGRRPGWNKELVAWFQNDVELRMNP